MSARDDTVITYEVREVIAGFHSSDAFEDTVAKLEKSGFKRDDIHMLASHDAVKRKLGGHFIANTKINEDESLPQTIYDDKYDITSEKRMAVGVPVYIGGLGAGLAIVATGGTLAFAGLIAAAGASVGAGIGSLIARSIGKHHADFLEKQLAMGALMVMVEVAGAEAETKATNLLKTAGGENVHAHSLTRYAVFDEKPLRDFDPYAFESF